MLTIYSRIFLERISKRSKVRSEIREQSGEMVNLEGRIEIISQGLFKLAHMYIKNLK